MISHISYSVRHRHRRDTTVHRSNSRGVLSSSLAEDVVSLVDTQCHVLQGFLTATRLWNTRTGTAIYVDAVTFVLQCLSSTQQRQKPLFMTTLEDCCEAANDFYRLSNKMEALLDQVVDEHSFLRSIRGLEDATDDASPEARLVRVWSDFAAATNRDAVMAAERAQVFILRSLNLQTTVPADLFSRSWEDVWTHNEVASNLVTHVESYLVDIQRYLCNDDLYRKALIITCKAIVCLYIRCLVEKAEAVSRSKIDGIGRKRSKPFKSAERALIRMMDDIIIIKEFFAEKAKGNTALSRILANEIYVLEVIHECLDANDENSVETFIVVIHKRTGADTLVTRHFVGDLWTLIVKEKQQWGKIDETLLMMQQDLHMVSTHMKAQSSLTGDKKKSELSFVRLDDMLKAMYEDRIVQGTLPVCWHCLPKEHTEGKKIVSRKIRAFTRSLTEMKWSKHRHYMSD